MSWVEDALTNRVITEQLPSATLETVWMTGLSSLFTVLLGLPLGLALVATSPGGLRPARAVNAALSVVVNVGRSFPFIILMIAILPLTRLLTGTTYGWRSAVVPLTLAAIPFFARLVETAVRDVSPGKVEAAQMVGASRLGIVGGVLVREALPALLGGVTVTVITLVGYSAMAGALGAGGLGALAVNHGYNRFQTDVMVVTVVVIIVLVQLLQMLGDLAVRLVDHR
ncbi:methionine ABC transporter permease [Georgenia sp. H159]|uniref:methionine ABC transporter permease n=1 Tax=Georgenia sp. H159 TaxID=3076115 RepID=UPI002D781979|nr:methionine ABC transporter permease [Georgenia sp. H159]